MDSKMMFSIIIPTYNCANLVKRAIDSVLRQCYEEFELIVVDDGSSDNTAQVIKGINSNKIKYIRQNNQGVSVARNTGIRHAKYDYICFLDADDIWMPDHLVTLKHLIEKYTAARMYITGYALYLRDGTIIPKSEKLLSSISVHDFECDNAFMIRRKYGYFLNTNCVCCHKDVFRKIGYFEPGVKNGEDDDLWYRVFAYYSVAISKKITTLYTRTHCGATSKKFLDSEWVFLERVPHIINDPDVPEDRKQDLLRIVEARKLSLVRIMISRGMKKDAFGMFQKLNKSMLPAKKIYVTVCAFIVPSTILLKILNYRDRNYYLHN